MLSVCICGQIRPPSGKRKPGEAALRSTTAICTAWGCGPEKANADAGIATGGSSHFAIGMGW